MKDDQENLANSFIECAACEGTGFIGPKNKPNTPIELIKVGCCNCSWCNGTGKVKELSVIFSDALRNSATKISKGRPIKPTINKE